MYKYIRGIQDTGILSGISTFPRYSYQIAANWDEWHSKPLDSLMKRLEQRWFIYFRYSINSLAQLLTFKSIFKCVFTTGL